MSQRDRGINGGPVAWLHDEIVLEVPSEHAVKAAELLVKAMLDAFAETFPAFRGIDLAARLRWLFDPLKPRAIAGGANNLGQNFTWSFHRDQSLKNRN